MTEYNLDKIRNYLAITVLGLAIISALVLILYLPAKTQYDNLISETILGQHPELALFVVNTSEPIQCQPCSQYGQLKTNFTMPQTIFPHITRQDANNNPK